MIFGIDEDGVVGTSSHARFAPDADRFIEIDYTVRAFEHGRGGASRNARRVGTLITTGDLVRATCLREDAHVDVLDIGARDAYGYDIFRFAGGRARMTPDAARVVDDLGPLDALILFFDHCFGSLYLWERVRVRVYVVQN
jgi:hypothetical protein